MALHVTGWMCLQVFGVLSRRKVFLGMPWNGALQTGIWNIQRMGFTSVVVALRSFEVEISEVLMG